MTYMNPQKRVRSGAQGVIISGQIATPVTHIFFLYMSKTDRLDDKNISHSYEGSKWSQR